MYKILLSLLVRDTMSFSAYIRIVYTDIWNLLSLMPNDLLEKVHGRNTLDGLLFREVMIK